MSSSTQATDQPNVWSYVPFAQKARRRSLSTANNTAPWDPFEKQDRHTGHSISRLDSFKTAWMNQSQQARWMKAGGVISVIILLYYFLAGSSNAGRNVYGSSDSPTDKCTRPYDKSKPLIQYALMVDAGSTGSRIHIYKFNNCGPTPELEDEVFKMTEKREGGSGLSSYKEDYEGAARSLDVLLDTAVRTVPEEYRSCTPIAVKATAGLRMLGEEMSDRILRAVRTRLETVYPFAVVAEEKGGVEIMGGDKEGVYAWITLNYLLGKIGGSDKSPTAAVFDLGGGSTQIVFQPTFPIANGGMPSKMAEGDHKYDLKFGGQEFELYQHSHLGYGLMAARDATHRHLMETIQKVEKDGKWLGKPILNPCIAPGITKKLDVTFPEGHSLGTRQTVIMQGPLDAIPAQCRALTEAILLKDKACAIAPCSFNGVHQPSLEKTFAREDVYIFSYFYDRLHELGMPESFTLRELHAITEKVCLGEKHWDAFTGIVGAVEELKGRPEACLDLNFMLSLLHTGYEMPMDREVRTAKKIKGNELGWCLGATLPLLEKRSGWRCRIKET